MNIIIKIRFPVRADIALSRSIQNGSGVQPPSYPVSTEGSLSRGKRPRREVGHSPPHTVQINVI